MKREFVAGYTLVEIIVAVAIVGILSAVALLQYQSYTMRARVAGALEFASESRTRVGVELSQNRNVKTDLLNNSGNPVNDITSLVWYPAKSGDPITGHIIATMKLPGQGVKNVFALELKGGLWKCVNAARYADPGTALDDEYLPAACRDGAAPIAPQGDSPTGPVAEVDAGCIEGDPASFKTKKGKDESRTDRPTFCTPDKTEKGDGAGGGSGGSANSTASATGSNSSATGSNDSSRGNNAGGDASGDAKASGANAGVASDKVVEGTASGKTANTPAGTTAAPDVRAGSADGAPTSGSTRSQSAGSSFGTKGGTTAVCGDRFELVNNTCTLAGSPSPRLCRSSKDNCETTHVAGKDCPAAQPFAANVVENLSDGSRSLTRRCMSRSEAFQGVRKNRETPDCANYDPNKTAYARFNCVFPCYGGECNTNIVPDDPGTRLTWDTEVVDASSGRKRRKIETDLPDLLDTWTCPRGSVADNKQVGRCIREAPAAVAKDGKAPDGAKPAK